MATVQYDLGWKPLFSIVSQQTGKQKDFIPFNMVTTNAQRYLKFEILVMTGNEAPVIGWINLGTKNFPYGLYNVTVRNNASSTNLDPNFAHAPIWSGIMNVYEANTNKSTKFEEYEEEQVQQVYITNEYQDTP